MKKFSLAVVAALGFLFVLLAALPAQQAPPAAAARPPDQPTITDALRGQDARLAVSVTLTAPRIQVGELVEQLARQSGVTLTVKDDTGAGNAEVTVALRHVPLADAMDSLWALVSYQNAEWEWRRSGDAGHYAYQLARSDAARRLASALKSQIQSDVENQAKTLEDALKMSPDELKQAADSDDLIQSMVTDGRVRPSISLFATLPTDVQTSLLRDHKTLGIPVSDLSPQMQGYVDQLCRLQQDLTTRMLAEHPEILTAPRLAWVPPFSAVVPRPKIVGISVHATPVSMAPVMTVDLGWGSGGIVGGLQEDRALRRKVDALWMLSGDAADDPQTARKAAALPASPVGGEENPYQRRLLELAQASPLSLMARIPQAKGYQDNASDVRPSGMTVQAYLEHLKKNAKYEHKWRDGVLLVANPAWVVLDDDDVVPPWAVVRRLRDAEAAQDGFLSLDDLSGAASELSEPTLRRLARQFPVMENVAVWHDLLALYHQDVGARSYLLSPQGSSRRDVLETVASTLNVNIDALNQQGIMPHTRLVQRPGTRNGVPSREIMIGIIKPGGTVLADQGFGYTGREYRPGVAMPPPGGKT